MQTDTHKKLSFIVICLSLLLTSLSIAQTITINRTLNRGRCILGQIFINDKLVCYSLELPKIGNIRNISSIPAGTYPAYIITDGDLGWRVALKNVPDRDLIRIHKGNSLSNTTGCIIVCTEFDDYNCTIPSGSSTKAMENFKNALYEAKITNDIGITVVITNNDCNTNSCEYGNCPECGCCMNWQWCDQRKCNYCPACYYHFDCSVCR